MTLSCPLNSLEYSATNTLEPSSLFLLYCWPKIALVDADITFLSNPLDYLDQITEDKDIVFQADSSRVRFLDAVMPYVFHYICGGFSYMKSNYATKHLWLSVLQYQENFLWNDQAGLNICIRHHTRYPDS